MQTVMQRLIDKLPPPANVKKAVVDWGRLEATLGFAYPPSFKEFVRVYGSCRWCDFLAPFYSTAETDEEVAGFLEMVSSAFGLLDGLLYDQDYQPISLPKYPEKGGIFPYMMDQNGGIYFWKTGDGDPDRWPTICWFMGPTIVLENKTLPQIMLDWLTGEPYAVEYFGDLSSFPPEETRLD
jgi:hypothetical protein